jgi:uncharacterized membrane protein
MKYFKNNRRKADEIPDAVQSNLEKVERYEKKHHEKRSKLQRCIERVSIFFGSSRFFILFVLFNIGWVLINYIWHRCGHRYFDDPPFQILQSIVTYIGVLITMAVMVRQNRIAQVEDSRTQLELQVNLLAEQKISKIIELLEELRRDMPDVRDRSDDHATKFQAVTNPDTIFDELDNRKSSVSNI